MKLLEHLFTLPWTPKGRKMRIEHLMKTTSYERDVCAAVIYTRDAALGRNLSSDETADANRVRRRLEKGEIVLYPKDLTR